MKYKANNTQRGIESVSKCESNLRCQVPTSSDDTPKGTWNVGPTKRWQVFREASKRVSGFDWGPVCPKKEVFVDTLNALRGDATAKELSHAGSGFLFRKVMPDTGGKTNSQAAKALQGKLDIAPGEIPIEFRRMAEKTVDKLFPKGWDRHWKEVAGNWKIPAGKAVLEEETDSRGYWEGRSGWWYEHVVGGVEPEGKEKWISEMRRVKVLNEGGDKKRVITIASGKQHVLAPLHNMIYSKLSRTKWLLRGDASSSSLSEFRYEKGEVFVSGDYEAATDNIPSSYSKLFIRLLRRNSRHVPEWIWDAAVDSMVGFIDWKRVKTWQGNGQLMGNYLSFPLLCLINYTTFLVGFGWTRGREIARKGLLAINGDDILFRCRRDEVPQWVSSVSSGGLILSMGKTLIHPRFASLNSTFFCITKIVKRVAIIRAKTWFYDRTKYKEEVKINSILGRVQRVRTDCNNQRPVIGLFLGVWAKEILKAGSGGLSNQMSLPVPDHVAGVTSAIHVIKNAVWEDALKRTEKDDKIDSGFGRGTSHGLAVYMSRLASERSHLQSFGAIAEDIKMGKNLTLPVSQEGGARDQLVDGVEYQRRVGRRLTYGITFRELWRMSKREWRRWERKGKLTSEGLVLRGLMFSGGPTFVVGGVLSVPGQKEGLWYPS